MTSRILIASIACVLGCIAVAQQTGVQAQGNASTPGRGERHASVGPNAMLNAVLSGSLDSKQARTGDPVTAETAEPLRAADGVRIPKGTKLLGRVTEARAAGKGEGESTLGFTFDRAVLKDGSEISLQATVRALAAAQDASSASPASIGRGSEAVGTLGTSGRIARNTVGCTSSRVGATAGVLAGSTGAVGGVTSRGMLSPDSQGVFGMRGVNLMQNAAGSGSLVTSAAPGVQLDSGTRMLLSVQRGASDR